MTSRIILGQLGNGNYAKCGIQVVCQFRSSILSHFNIKCLVLNYVFNNKRCFVTSSTDTIYSKLLCEKQNSCCKNYVSSTTKRYSSFQKIVKSQLPATFSQTEFVAAEESEFLHVKTLANCLELIQTSNSRSISLAAINDAVRSLFTLIKSERVDEENRNLVLNGLAMEKFNKILQYKVRFMEVEDLINVAKLYVFLNAPASHLTFQIVLKLLSKQANSMDLNQIVYISFILSKQNTKSPLAEALEFALPVVFESQLPSQLDYSELGNVCDYLHYASKSDLSDKTVEIIVKRLLKENPEKFKPRQSMSIIWSLADTKRNFPYQAELIEMAFTNMNNNIETFKADELSTTLKKTYFKFKRYPFFYNENFVDTVCNRQISRNNDPRNALYLFKTVSIFRHINVEFMDRVGEIIAEDQSLVLQDKRLLINVVRSFSNCNYKPEQWPVIEEMILDSSISTGSLLTDITFAVDVICLDVFPNLLISKIFNPDNLANLNEILVRSSHPIALAVLHTAINVLYKDQYSGDQLPGSFIESLQQKMKNKRRYNLPLKNPLISAFGGEQYVISEIYNNGIFIDHGIVMRKGGYPVATNWDKNVTSELNSIAALTVPNSVIVLIKVFFKEAYANNSSRLRGMHALEMKLLEKSGYPVVSIDAVNWTDLPDYEKIPYLMHQIKDKIDKFQWNQNTSDVIPS